MSIESEITGKDHTTNIRWCRLHSMKEKLNKTQQKMCPSQSLE